MHARSNQETRSIQTHSGPHTHTYTQKYLRTNLETHGLAVLSAVSWSEVLESAWGSKQASQAHWDQALCNSILHNDCLLT